MEPGVDVSEFDSQTPENEIAAFVDAAKTSPVKRDQLVKLLPERHALYGQRSTNEVNRLRGYMLAAFEHAGLPDKAIPHVLDSLENGKSAYLVAAAATATRGVTRSHASFVPFLFKGIRNIEYRDDALTFDCYRPSWPLENSTSALAEIFKTFAWLGAYAKPALPKLEDLFESGGFGKEAKAELGIAIAAITTDSRKIELDCCAPLGIESQTRGSRGGHRHVDTSKIELEDQDGVELSFDAFFSQKVSIVVFFYTRCQNPNKCPLTIAQLIALQEQLERQGLAKQIKTAAITYDPVYDRPIKLKEYGTTLGFDFSENNRMLRTATEFDVLNEHFQLGVNFQDGLVNLHRIELYVLDSTGDIVSSFTRLQWKIQEVIDEAKKWIGREPKKLPMLRRLSAKISTNSFLSMALPILVAIFPKCPLCWAAYLSIFGVAQRDAISYVPWILPVIIGALLINLLVLYRTSKIKNGKIPFILSFVGTACLLFIGMIAANPPIMYAGIGLLLAGTILHNLPFPAYVKLKQHLFG